MLAAGADLPALTTASLSLTYFCHIALRQLSLETRALVKSGTLNAYY